MTARDRVASWIDGYERAWRTSGTAGLADLFTADATYLQGPYEAPAVGLAAIEAMWDAEREGPDEAFTMAYEIVAVDGDTAVARIDVRYGDPVTQEYLDLWVMRFEEWPHWPQR